MMVLITFRLRTQPAQSSTTIVFNKNSHVFTHQKHMVFDDVHICFVTCFSIDFWCVWASSLAPFGHPFGIKTMFPRNRFFLWFVGSILNFVIFSSLFRNSFREGALGRPLAHFGTLWVPFIFIVVGTFSAPTWEPFSMFFHFFSALICWWFVDGVFCKTFDKT